MRVSGTYQADAPTADSTSPRRATGTAARPRPGPQINAQRRNRSRRPNPIQTARTAALAQPTRKAQIHAYYSTGPILPLLTGQDFIDNCQTVNAAIALILQGAPPELFDWTDPPTEQSIRRNNPARIRALWDAVKPPQRERP